MGIKLKTVDGRVQVEYKNKKLGYNLVVGFIHDYGDLGFMFRLEYSLYSLSDGKDLGAFLFSHLNNQYFSCPLDAEEEVKRVIKLFEHLEGIRAAKGKSYSPREQ